MRRVFGGVLALFLFMVGHAHATGQCARYYCVGPCGTLSTTLTCVAQDCVLHYCSDLVSKDDCVNRSQRNCLWNGNDVGGYCELVDDIGQEPFYSCSNSQESDRTVHCDPDDWKDGKEDDGVPDYVCPCYTGDCDGNGGGGNGSCTPSLPSDVSLESPEDGAGEPSETVRLEWSGPSDWGTGCPSNSNEYKVYVEEDSSPDGYVPVDSSHLRATLDSSVKRYDFSGERGRIYEWKVIATNGSGSQIVG